VVIIISFDIYTRREDCPAWITHEMVEIGVITPRNNETIIDTEGYAMVAYWYVGVKTPMEFGNVECFYAGEKTNEVDLGFRVLEHVLNHCNEELNLKRIVLKCNVSKVVFMMIDEMPVKAGYIKVVKRSWGYIKDNNMDVKFVWSSKRNCNRRIHMGLYEPDRYNLYW